MKILSLKIRVEFMSASPEKIPASSVHGNGGFVREWSGRFSSFAERRGAERVHACIYASVSGDFELLEGATMYLSKVLIL